MNPQILQMLMARQRMQPQAGMPYNPPPQQAPQNFGATNPQMPQMNQGQLGGGQQQGQGQGSMSSMIPMLLQMMRQKQGGAGGGVSPQTTSMLSNNIGTGNPLSLY